MGRIIEMRMVEDTCDLCGRPTYGESAVCRQCRKREEAGRRVLRLAKERKHRRGVYGKV